MKNQSLRKGFTLIEVVIVLAIAALIMVVVFLAVQGAQRGQRDNTRKDIANRTLSAVTAFKGNNSGTPPTTAAHMTDLANNYMRATNGTLTAQGMTFTWQTGALGACPQTAPGTGGPVRVQSGASDTVSVCLEAAAAAYSVNN